MIFLKVPRKTTFSLSSILFTEPLGGSQEYSKARSEPLDTNALLDAGGLFGQEGSRYNLLYPEGMVKMEILNSARRSGGVHL